MSKLDEFTRVANLRGEISNIDFYVALQLSSVRGFTLDREVTACLERLLTEALKLHELDRPEYCGASIHWSLGNDLGRATKDIFLKRIDMAKVRLAQEAAAEAQSVLDALKDAK